MDLPAIKGLYASHSWVLRITELNSILYLKVWNLFSFGLSFFYGLHFPETLRLSHNSINQSQANHQISFAWILITIICFPLYTSLSVCTLCEVLPLTYQCIPSHSLIAVPFMTLLCFLIADSWICPFGVVYLCVCFLVVTLACLPDSVIIFTHILYLVTLVADLVWS